MFPSRINKADMSKAPYVLHVALPHLFRTSVPLAEAIRELATWLDNNSTDAVYASIKTPRL